MQRSNIFIDLYHVLDLNSKYNNIKVIIFFYNRRYIDAADSSIKLFLKYRTRNTCTALSDLCTKYMIHYCMYLSYKYMYLTFDVLRNIEYQNTPNTL